MQNGGTSKPTGPLLAAIGGILMALGAVMTWATASLNLDAFARALGIDPAQIPVGSVPSSRSFAGTSGSDGKIALIVGIVVLLLAVAAWARPQLRVPVGILAILGGLVGGGLALYDIGKKGDIIAGAKEVAGPTLSQLGVDPGILDSVFKISLGIGIYLTAIAGAVAIVGGLLILTQKSAAPVAATDAMSGGFATPPPPADMGFGSSTPPAPMPSSMPAAPAEAPPATTDAPASPAEPETPGPGAHQENGPTSS